MNKRAVLPIILLLFVPSSSASILTSESAQSEDATIAAELAILKLLPRNGYYPSPVFELKAPQIYIELDNADVVDGVQRIYINPSTSKSDHKNATITGLQNGQDARLVIDSWPGHAAPTVETIARCSTFGPADRPFESTPVIIRRDERQDGHTDLRNTVRSAPCNEPSLLSIHGDFRLALWDWTAHVLDDDGDHPLRTGVYEDDNIVSKKASEAFAFVSNGYFTINLNNPYAFYVSDANITAKSLTLENARGRISQEDGTRVLDGEDLTLYGVRDTRLTGQGVGEPLQIEVPERRDLSPSTQGPKPPLQTPYTPAAVAALALAVAAGLFVRYRPLIYVSRKRRQGTSLGSRAPRDLRQHRGVGYLFMARSAHVARRPRLALHYARRAHALFSESPDVRLMLATAYSHRDRYDEALPHYLAASGMWSVMGQKKKQAEAVLGIAMSNAALGSTDRALDAYALLADLDPELARSRLGAPAILLLRDLPRFAHILQRLRENLFGSPDTSVT